jgi:hypothetical protein
MNKDENLHWEKAENIEMTGENTKQEPAVKSKTKTKGAVKDPAKRINDYFPVVPKANQEKGEDSGVASKDESRVTEHTTPDKWVAEILNGRTNSDSKGKIPTPNRYASVATHALDIYTRHHY